MQNIKAKVIYLLYYYSHCFSLPETDCIKPAMQCLSGAS